MTTALVPHAGKDEISREQIELLKRTICAGSTDDELSMFVQTAQRLHLDPFARQVFAVKRWDSRAKREVMAIQVSIDGFRLVAERTGKYAGQLGPFWSSDGKEWLEVWLSKEPPAAAKVAVLRHDFKEPVWSVATWEQYKQTKNDGGITMMWAKMGPLMLAKCAESLALRRAFPNELSGIYTQEEMAQAAPAEPEYAPPKASADQNPKAYTPAPAAEPRSAGTDIATTATSASGKPPAPASIKHDGILATPGQIKLLHTLKTKLGMQECDGKCVRETVKVTKTKGNMPVTVRCVYHTQLAKFEDQAGKPITTSTDLAKVQMLNLLARYEAQVAKMNEKTAGMRPLDMGAIIPIREPGADDEEEMASPDELADLETAAGERWGDSYKEFFPEWLKGAFDYDSVLEMTRQEAIDATRMIREGR